MSDKFTVKYRRTGAGHRVVLASVYWDGEFVTACAEYWNGRTTRLSIESQLRGIRMAFLTGRESALKEIKEWAA